jgi:hypothetical protein
LFDMKPFPFLIICSHAKWIAEYTRRAEWNVFYQPTEPISIQFSVNL